MTREKMLKVPWKAYMKITYKTDHMEREADCMLLSIDFENELMELVPFDKAHEEYSFTANIKYCELFKRKPFEIVADDEQEIVIRATEFQDRL